MRGWGQAARQADCIGNRQRYVVNGQDTRFCNFADDIDTLAAKTDDTHVKLGISNVLAKLLG